MTQRPSDHSLLKALEALRDLILSEWPRDTMTEVVERWGQFEPSAERSTVEAVREVEEWLDAKETP